MRLLSAGLLMAAPAAALAHGFAQRYDLPVPLGLYITGAALTVALSFGVIAFFVRGRRAARDYPRFDLLRSPLGGLISSRWLIGLLRLLSVAGLVVVVVAGFVGAQNPYKNIAPTVIWVIWWVGFAYISGLIGNLWSLLNPWSSVFRWAESLVTRLTPARRLGLGLAWPKWLGNWPAVLLFVWFVWAELVWPESDNPAKLSLAALTYSILTWLGMLMFGRHAWLRHGEAFSLVFGFFARFSCTEIRVTDSSVIQACSAAHGHAGGRAGVDCLECFERAPAAERQLNLRPWAVGLLTDRPIGASATVFVLVMLASVTFDGLLATPLWAEIASWMLYSQELRPLILALQGITGNAIASISTIAMLIFFLLFFVLYGLFNILMFFATPAAARRGTTVGQLIGSFVLSLVPIALAYHLAHYLSFLLIVGQYVIPLASDPFGLGWNLFGTRLYMVDIGIVGARFVWITSVVAIVIGHIVAVWLGHVMALRTFRDNRAALLSQVPMLLLMVGYTMLSLWILAQPVVETG